MSRKETNNNNEAAKPGSTKHLEKPRDSEYNLPLVLIDSTRDPPRTFHRGNLLGTGGFAKVFLVKDEIMSKSFADKVISKAMFKRRKSAKQKVEKEIKIHSRMNHVNVIAFHRFFEDSDYVHLLLELAPQKTLLHVNKYRRLVTECEARYYAKQIFAGTSYIHSQHVLHRDLKLGNMFLSSNMVVKIGDFGLATSFSENQPGSLCGTPNYIAPEVLAKKGHSISSEVWSIGCMVYALLCGAPPFETESVTSTYQLISNCDYKIPPHLSLLAVEFIQSMLTENPDYRGCLTDPPPTSDSLNLQSHPFLVEGFTPATLPCSALNTTPVFTDSCISTGLSIPDKRFYSAVNIPTQERSESSTGCGSFSPLFSPLGSKVKGFFTSKKKFLDQAIAGLTASLAVKKCDSFYEEQIVLKLAPVFISKWVDYSNKFGFGFQMSDGSVGVLFNDKTKIGCSADSDMVQFTDLNGKTFSFHWDENANQPFPELSERVDILKYYMQYMDKNLADSITFLPGMETVKTGKKTMVPQMSIWSRHGDCVVMEMTNNMVQINHLSDHIKVVIWGFEGNQLVTIISTRSSQTYSLAHPCPLNIRSKLENTLKEIKEMSKKKATEGNI